MMETTKDIQDYGGSGGQGRQQRCKMMRTASVEMQEDKISNISWENINGVPLGGTATAALMESSPYPV